MKRHFVIGLLIYTISSNAQDQVAEKNFPGHRDQVSLIYHLPSKVLMLIGGFQAVPDSTQSDVWKWDGKAWARIDASGPGSRYFFQGALNPRTGKIYFFGGTGIGEYEDRRDDLWSFDGLKWSRETATDIGTRDHHKMVYADHMDAFVLYGGIGRGLKPDTTTWILRNGEFTPLNLPGPGIRYHAGMVYDKNRNKVVLYGGADKVNEHWEFDGAKWTQVTTSVNPGIRYHHHMAYDENNKAVILHGGWVNLNARDPKNYERPATWMWNGKNWKKIASDNVFPLAIAYDAARKSIVAYGYDNGDRNATRAIGLWELQNNKWNKIQDNGTYNKVEYLKHYLDKNPNDAIALMVYANELKNSSRYADAEIVYRRIEADVLYDKVMYGLTEVLILQNKFDEVARYISGLEQSGGIPREIYSRTASSLHSMKQYALAVPYYEKALVLKPVATDYYNLGCALALLNDKSKAFEALNRAAELGFNSRKSYESDADLDILRSDSRWNVLLAKLK